MDLEGARRLQRGESVHCAGVRGFCWDGQVLFKDVWQGQLPAAELMLEAQGALLNVRMTQNNHLLGRDEECPQCQRRPHPKAPTVAGTRAERAIAELWPGAFVGSSPAWRAFSLRVSRLETWQRLFSGVSHIRLLMGTKQVAGPQAGFVRWPEAQIRGRASSLFEGPALLAAVRSLAPHYLATHDPEAMALSAFCLLAAELWGLNPEWMREQLLARRLKVEDAVPRAPGLGYAHSDPWQVVMYSIDAALPMGRMMRPGPRLGDYVDQVSQSHIWRRWRPGRLGWVLAPGRKWAAAGLLSGAILTPKRGVSWRSVIHEAAHFLSAQAPSAHGPEFAWMYRCLLGEMLGEELVARFDAAASRVEMPLVPWIPAKRVSSAA